MGPSRVTEMLKEVNEPKFSYEGEEGLSEGHCGPEWETQEEQVRISHGPRGKPSTIVLLKEHIDKVTPNNILQYSLISLAQPSYRDPQLEIVQRVRDVETLS